MSSNFRLKWYHGVIFFIIVNLIAFGWGIEVPEYYANLNKPWFAPATWVFGIAWTVNNILVIAGNIWAFNLFQNLQSNKDKILSNSKTASIFNNLKLYGTFQVLSWVNFIIFQYISFGTQIPAMFFWPTFSMLIITVVSMYFAGQIDTQRSWVENPKLPRSKAFWQTVMEGRSIIFTFITLIVWLSIASLLGYHIWLNN